MNLLDPLEVDRRHHTDEQIDMAGDVDVLADDPSMQALVEEAVRAVRQGSQSVKVPGGRSQRADCSALWM